MLTSRGAYPPGLILPDVLPCTRLIHLTEIGSKQKLVMPGQNIRHLLLVPLPAYGNKFFLRISVQTIDFDRPYPPVLYAGGEICR